METSTKRTAKKRSPAAGDTANLRKPSRPSPASLAERYSPPENRARSQLIVSVVALVVGGLFIFLSFGMG